MALYTITFPAMAYGGYLGILLNRNSITNQDKPTSILKSVCKAGISLAMYYPVSQLYYLPNGAFQTFYIPINTLIFFAYGYLMYGFSYYLFAKFGIITRPKPLGSCYREPLLSKSD